MDRREFHRTAATAGLVTAVGPARSCFATSPRVVEVRAAGSAPASAL